jgi:DNA-binding transcriptional ArsR family regulator
MATKSFSGQTARQNHLKAMVHELRHEIWLLLYERVASPKELAETLDANLSNVSHHTKELVRLGCAELVETRPVRGTVEHFYRSTRPVLIDDSDWTALVDENPRLAEYLFAQNTQALFDDITRSVKAGTVGTDNQFLIDRTPVKVDSQGCDELIELFDRIEQNEVVEILKRSAERRARGNGDTVHMSVCLAILKTPPPR